MKTTVQIIDIPELINMCYRTFYKIIAFLSIAFPPTLFSGPTSLFWTNCTTDVEDTGVLKIDVDNYNTPFNGRAPKNQFPPQLGFLVGLFTWKSMSGEVGFDYFGGENYPISFNAKVSVEANKLFTHSPSMSVGICNVGTQTRGSEATNQNILQFVIGKSLTKNEKTRLFLGGFTGNRAMGKNRQGFMVGLESKFCETKDPCGEKYDRWILEIDYASGKNTIGGGGIGINYSFTPCVSILTGPVWFNSLPINGYWKWSIQINFHKKVF